MHVKAILSATLFAISTVCLAQESEIVNLQNIEKIVANKSNFTGKATVQNLFYKRALGNSYAGVVSFEQGSCTYWHSHPRGQVLIVTSGRGYIQNEDGPLQTIKEGDVVICPKDMMHWYGATEDSAMTHIAISEIEPRRNVTWGKEVSKISYE